jgi:hypothetical protein
MKKDSKFYEVFKEWFLKIEGMDHFVASTIVIIGMLATHIHGFWAYALPIMDYIMGAGTFYIGWREGKKSKGEKQ